jgi:hypothetical protein
MKFYIDTENKKIVLFDTVKLKEFFDFLEQTIVDWREYSLVMVPAKSEDKKEHTLSEISDRIRHFVEFPPNPVHYQGLHYATSMAQTMDVQDAELPF